MPGRARRGKERAAAAAARWNAPQAEGRGRSGGCGTQAWERTRARGVSLRLRRRRGRRARPGGRVPASRPRRRERLGSGEPRGRLPGGFGAVPWALGGLPAPCGGRLRLWRTSGLVGREGHGASRDASAGLGGLTRRGCFRPDGVAAQYAAPRAPALPGAGGRTCSGRHADARRVRRPGMTRAAPAPCACTLPKAVRSRSARLSPAARADREAGWPEPAAKTGAETQRGRRRRAPRARARCAAWKAGRGVRERDGRGTTHERFAPGSAGGWRAAEKSSGRRLLGCKAFDVVCLERSRRNARGIGRAVRRRELSPRVFKGATSG